MNENKSRAEIAELYCDIETLRERAKATEVEHREKLEEIAKAHDCREAELTEYSQQLIEDFEVLKKEVRILNYFLFIHDGGSASRPLLRYDVR